MSYPLPSTFKTKYSTDEQTILEKNKVNLSYSKFAEVIQSYFLNLFTDMHFLDLWVRQEKQNNMLQVNWMIGDTFIFRLYQDNFPDEELSLQLCIWDNTGEVSVFAGLVPMQKEHSFEFVKKVLHTLDRYNEGFISCADCGKEMTLEDGFKRMIFAGAMCENCYQRYME